MRHDHKIENLDLVAKQKSKKKLLFFKIGYLSIESTVCFAVKMFN